MINDDEQVARQDPNRNTKIPHQMKISTTNPANLRALTRLIIGAAVLGADTLRYRLHDWENSLSQTTIYHNENAPPKIINGEIVGEPKASSEQYHDSPLRHALIGLIFDTQERVRSSSKLLGRGTRVIGNIAKPVLTPIKNHRLLSPLRSRYRKLVSRGESEVARWIEIGRVEERYSRKLANTAFDDTVDMSLEYMAENPEVQDLIQAQGAGLAFELIEEVRERTVSGDTYLEGVVRSIFWRTPRSDLPGPSGDVRSLAHSLRPPNKGREQDNPKQ